MMKNRNLVYLLVFTLTLSLAVPALAQEEKPPGKPDLRDTKLSVSSKTASPGEQITLEATLEGETDTSGEYETLSGVTLYFTFQGTTKSGETGSEGIASATFTAPSSSGEYDYEAEVQEFQKDGNNYAYSSTTETVTVSTGAEVATTFSGGTWWADTNNNQQWDGEPDDTKYTGYGVSGNKVAIGLLSSTSTTTSTELNLNTGKGLALNSVMIYPNPVSAADQVTFSVQGKSIEEMKVEVFAASGSKVFSSGYVNGQSISWDLTSASGKVSNGIFLYKVAVKGSGSTLASDVQKLLVLQ